jgi:hypothetical protein
LYFFLKFIFVFPLALIFISLSSVQDLYNTFFLSFHQLIQLLQWVHFLHSPFLHEFFSIAPDWYSKFRFLNEEILLNSIVQIFKHMENFIHELNLIVKDLKINIILKTLRNFQAFSPRIFCICPKFIGFSFSISLHLFLCEYSSVWSITHEFGHLINLWSAFSKYGD